MEVIKTVKLKMTVEEMKAIKTVFHMLYNLGEADERALANALDYSDLESVRIDLALLCELGGGDVEEL